jgi:adenylate cyclase
MAKVETTVGDDHRWCPNSIERSLRLWAGIVLMVFVTTHLVNHALGLFGVAFMTEVQEWRVAAWRSAPGTVLLLGALLVHVGLTLKRTISRRSWRMPKLEWLQIAMGLVIPVMLLQHVVSTRVLATFAGVHDPYINILRYVWPENVLWQTMTLLLVWIHGCIGMYFVFKPRAWFQRLHTVFMVVAVVVPLLSLAGMVSAGREAAKLSDPPENWNTAQLAVYENAMTNGRWLVYGTLGLALAALLARMAQLRFRPSVAVRITGHGAIKSPVGLTLLEMSRRNQIPHPSVCGGKGRCASCRVLVLNGMETLPVPSGLEKKMLERIRAPKQVRLACQIRPTEDLNVRILLPTDAMAFNRASAISALDWGVETELTVLFADIRGFSSLARNQLPADLVVLLNRVIDEMTQATLANGGRVAMVETDGIMAVFGLDESNRTGARAAVDAAIGMLKAIEADNREIGSAMPQPLRIGIGVHTGHVVASHIGDAERGYQLVVIGEAVVAASRLEEATKELAADCIISSETLVAAGLTVNSSDIRQLHYKNGEAPVAVAVFAELDDLRNLANASTKKNGRKRAANPDDAPEATELSTASAAPGT